MSGKQLVSVGCPLGPQPLVLGLPLEPYGLALVQQGCPRFVARRS